MRKRSTFRARKPAKMINAAYRGYTSRQADHYRAAEREAAAKERGAEALPALVKASKLRWRKEAERASAYRMGLAQYHPRCNTETVPKWCRDALDFARRPIEPVTSTKPVRKSRAKAAA